MSDQQSTLAQQTILPSLTTSVVPSIGNTAGVPLIFGSGSPLLTVIPSHLLLQVSPAPQTGVSAADSTDQAADESTYQNAPSSNMESTQGSRGRGRGQGIRNRGLATCGSGTCENAPRQGHKSWTQSKNDKGKSELDLTVDWLTVEGNYQMWGAQITCLEKKFRDALAFKDQTGQGILEEAKELQRQIGNPGNDSGAENFVETAKFHTEVLIRKQCLYFYKLEPVMGDGPSAAPMAWMEQGNDDLVDGLSDHSEIGGEDQESANSGLDNNESCSASKDESLPEQLPPQPSGRASQPPYDHPNRLHPPASV
ncbi:hypothetical protein PCASD_10269 [Puccinia coronata f. sp. avenae]|uniref:Uncharacterized protein n=1 Tax=Puccinia coronata f. sp. avenae TaxID=200324 RepID=A0A2N5UIE8_9BASI|nr:hypothetical protein PCASD_10269 [Puccinia coronata f. sp. avenae]